MEIKLRSEFEAEVIELTMWNADQKFYYIEEMRAAIEMNISKLDIQKKALIPSTEVPADLDQLQQLARCKICLTKVVNVFFTRCKHLALCGECAKKSTDSKCPVCRTEVEGMLPVYLV